MNAIDIAEQFEKHLNSPKQSWLLGAGISYKANIPLMYPLTARALKMVRSVTFKSDPAALDVLDFVTDDCGENSHIEHHLTHLADLISLAERSRTKGVNLGGKDVALQKLIDVHQGIIEQIAYTVRWGYRPAYFDKDGNITTPEIIGDPQNSIIDISGHLSFVKAIFGANRAGLEFLRSHVDFYTTNYDTLLEDAMALSEIEYQDGFTGGGVGFWSIENYRPRQATRALLSKLHGSVDWYRPASGGPSLWRVRHSDTYPVDGGSVMIYPQATKYLNAQKDPFAALFQRLRARISQGSDHVLLICGYSFGDEHINAEIESAMASGANQLTIVAFAGEASGALPATLQTWRNSPWGHQLFIASPSGLFQGNSEAAFALETADRDWWTFEGATRLLSDGLPKDIQEAIA